MNERRQSVRVQCELPTLIRDADSDSPQAFSDAVVLNISIGGLCIRTDRFVPIQSHLSVYLSLPDRPTIEVRVAPAWIVQLPQPGKYEMGARFVEMRPEDENAIQTFQYRSLLERIPPRPSVLKDLQKNQPPESP